MFACQRDIRPIRDTTVHVRYVTLDSPALGPESFKNIKVERLVEGKTLQPVPATGHDAGYELYEDINGDMIIKIFSFPEIGTQRASLIMSIADNQQDTLTLFFEAPNEVSMICSSVLINDSLTWDAANPAQREHRLIEIVVNNL